MCGIFLRVGKPIASFLPLREATVCGEKAAQAELSKEEISALVNEHLQSRTLLSADDQLKLDNVAELRSATVQMEELRNGKLSAAGRAESIRELERKIENLRVGKPVGSERHDEHDQSDADAVRDAMINTFARGPDYACYTEVTFRERQYQLVSSVLSLRQPFTKQPIFESSLVLQFNGEIYNRETVSLNDTAYVMSLIQANLQLLALQEAVIATFSALDGEYAFVLLDLQEETVYFGKDYVGKRSLLHSLTSELQIGSVLGRSATECKGNTLSVVDLLTLTKRDFEIRKCLPVQREAAETESAVLDLHTHLKEACLVRQQTIVPSNAQPSLDTSATAAVLFSGGLDCTVVAALLAENYEQTGDEHVIDLLSVGFEHPRTGVSASELPDRKLSEKSWWELCRKFENSSVSFRLVHVDVQYREWLAHKKRVFLLISPCATEMDLSIAIAFYFASRATNCTAIEKKGPLPPLLEMSEHFRQQSSDPNCGGPLTFKKYTSSARVLFSGLGADELYGGYSRHENIFNNLEETEDKTAADSAYNALRESLIHDIDVIYERNLGRDDRAMAIWGKEVRYPYLDENVVHFSLHFIDPKLKMKYWWETRTTKKRSKRVKVYERKHILREVARHMGMPHAGLEIKRAIQFGARSAKLEVGQSKVRGTDRAV